MARHFWQQALLSQWVTRLRFVPSPPHQSSGIDRRRGDIVETAPVTRTRPSAPAWGRMLYGLELEASTRRQLSRPSRGRTQVSPARRLSTSIDPAALGAGVDRAHHFIDSVAEAPADVPCARPDALQAGPRVRAHVRGQRVEGFRYCM